VRDHLSDKEEAVQNEILEGLRDHINEAISRTEAPITTENIESILAKMDAPSSYAEEPAHAAGSAARRASKLAENKWLYVVLAFLMINCFGVWKLVEIERKTGGGSDPGDAGTVGRGEAGNPQPGQAGGTTFHSAAFMENKEPVLMRADETVRWLFSENVVPSEDLGKKLANPPMKMIPEIPGDYQWKSAAELVFAPTEEWRPNKSFKAELNNNFTTHDGARYTGTRVWSFRTVDFGLESVSLSAHNGLYSFDLGFTIAPDPRSLSEKLKLFYVNADGESVPLDYTMIRKIPARSALVRTQIVPAISFLVQISPGLSADHWKAGTEEILEKKIQNSLTFSLDTALHNEQDPSNPVIVLSFSKETGGVNAETYISISPNVPMNITKDPRNARNLLLSGGFAPGVSYDVKVKRGLVSVDGCVMSYDATRSVVFSNPQQVVAEPEIAKKTFDLKLFSKHGAGVIASGKEELIWEFGAEVVGAGEIGMESQDSPVELTPKVEGSFRWKSTKQLAFTPATGWELNQFYSARIVRDIKTTAGAIYTGPRFWAFSTPRFALASVAETGNTGGNQFSLYFTGNPDITSLRETLRVYYLSENGQQVYANSVVTQGPTPSIMIASLAAPTTGLVHFEISPGLRHIGWETGTRNMMQKEATRSTILRVQEVRHNGEYARVPAVQVRFSEEVNVKDASAFIEVSPNVKFSVQKDSDHQNQLLLCGGFQGETRYEVKIKAGLVSKIGNVLANETKTAVSFPRLRASLSFDADGRYLSPAGNMLIPVKSVNLKECRVSVAPIMATNLVAFARDDHENRSYQLNSGSASNTEYDDYEGRYSRGTNIEDMTGNVSGKEMKLPGSRNIEATNYLNLHDFTNGKGAYIVQVRGKSEEGTESYDQVKSDSRLVVITDLGITAKTSNTAVFVWVCSLKDAMPAAGVEVTAFSRNNQLIAKSVTNSDGVASIPCDTRDKSKTPYLVTAQLADDLSYLRLDGNALAADMTESVREYRSDGCEAFLFTDRGIFRPGETLHAKAIIRNSDFSVPSSFPVVFQIIKPDGRIYKELPAMPNSFGIAEIESVMSEFLPTGRYSLTLRVPRAKDNLGTTSFLLEDFVPPQIRVKAKVEQERFEAGQPIVADIFAEHLFGSPAAGLKANAKCILSVSSFAHKKWGDFIFGGNNQRAYGYYEDKPSFEIKPVDIGDLVLNDEGKARATIDTGSCLKAPGPIQALIQATVFEPSGRSITTSVSTTVDPYPFYIGLKRPADSYVRTGDQQKISVITVFPDGEARKEGKPLLVKISKVDWNYTYKRSSDGSYVYRSYKEEVPIKEDTFAFSSTPSDYLYSPESSGNHQISFTDPDSGSTSSLSFYASDYGQSWTSSQKGRPDSLTLKLDKAEYSDSDKAKLTIQAPFAGTALLTIESDRVLESRYIKLEKNTAEIEFDIKASFVPNVHCTVSVMRPAVAESTWTGHRAFGSIPLKISPKKHRLNVALEVPVTILPQSTLNARILLKDDAGLPADGEVTLIAVDEAICMLTSFKTPSPLAWLYELRRLGVKSHDVYSSLMPVLDESVLNKDSHISGDGEDNADAATLLTRRLNPIKANRFKPVSLWVSKIMVKDGVAEVNVNVPEFTGELRIMAIACNAQMLGSAQGTVKVKRPLIVQPSLPRFLAPGDECVMSVNVFNEIGKDVTAKLAVTCGGPLSAKQTEQSVDIKNGASALLFVPVVAGNIPGKAFCSVTCEADSVRFSDTIEIAVRPPMAAEVVSDSGILGVGMSVEVPIPDNWIAESLFRNIRISADPTLELGTGLQYLLRYPYGCLEQTTSSAFPLLYLSDLANRSLEHSMSKDDVRAYVTAGIWRLLSMQQSSGGFSYWRYSPEPDLWTSTYATHFLVEAKKAGYDVPEDCLKRALGALRANLEMNRADTELNAYEFQLRYDIRAYGCYVLAIAGEPEYAWQTRMLEMKDKISYYARLLNASALLLQGEPKRAVLLLKELGLPGEGVRDMGGAFNSTNRNTALLLSAWLDIDPRNENVLKLVDQLNKSKRNGYWGSTQENAMVMLALGKYAQRNPKASIDFKGAITMPNGVSETFDHTKDKSWSSSRGEVGKITITNHGPGTFLYSFRTEGIPNNPAEYYHQQKGGNEGLIVGRTWLDDQGNPINILDLKQNALVVAKITLNPNGNAYDNIAIEDLLPAGLEIENPNLDTAQSLPWLTRDFAWCFHRDIRDDRLLLFTRPVSASRTFYYVARAVTPGKYIVPPITAECMYKPEVRSVNDQGIMVITK
jgi:uncharacterized protein YfaS (alpha-2-macroglobulin family)